MTSITLSYPGILTPAAFIQRFGDVSIASPYPWFAPRPLISYGYSIYQVATVITLNVSKYPGCGTRDERDAWSKEYETAQKRANDLAQLQAPGCELLEASVLGRTYVWPIKRDLAAEQDDFERGFRSVLRAAINVGTTNADEFVYHHTPLQRVTFETYTKMLEFLPPFKWNPRGPLVRGHLMSEFMDGNITSAFFYRPDSKDAWHAYVDGTKTEAEIWADIDKRLTAAETAQREAREYLAGKGVWLGLLALTDITAQSSLAEAQRRAADWRCGLYVTEVGGSLKAFDLHSYILQNEA